MQFLKTLFWVALAVGVALFATANWHPVTLNLWGGLKADVKVPVLVFIAFLAGFVPMLVVHRARLWGLQRRLEVHERHAGLVVAEPIGRPVPAPGPVMEAPAPEPLREEDRLATDSKAWPAQ